MQELSLNTQLNTKTSAPERETDKELSGKKVPVSDTVAEAAKSENGNVGSLGVDQRQESEQSEERVQEAVARLNDYVQNSQRKLEFQLDENSGQTIVRVYDKVSDELIRQIPEHEVLVLAQKLNSEEPLMLFSAQV